MSNVMKALLWATAILITANITSANGMSESASFGVTMGLVGAAWGSIARNKRNCGTGCA